MNVTFWNIILMFSKFHKISTDVEYDYRFVDQRYLVFHQEFLRHFEERRRVRC